MIKNTTETPPNHIKAIFPVKGNEKAVTKAALSHGIVAYPESNILLFEGNLSDYHNLKDILRGGVTAH